MSNLFVFIFNSILLGLGLAMDAFSVSLANGLNEPFMRKRKSCVIAGVFSVFQALMPLIGWYFVHTLVSYFTAFQRYIPIIALILLCYIGGKMFIEGIKNNQDTSEKTTGIGALLVQGVATSIDALSVGFTISKYNALDAVVCAFIIAAVTFIICYSGVIIGKRFGTHLSNKATIFGGIILIAIGLEIFISSLL